MTNQSNSSRGLTEARTPWAARSDGDDDGLWTVEDASGGIVFFGMDEDRAHLFAAAPDMLAASESLIASLDPDTLNPEQFNAWCDLSNALAKAVGAES